MFNFHSTSDLHYSPQHPISHTTVLSLDMARTHDPPAPRSLRQPQNTTKADVIPKSAKKGVTKVALKTQESVKAVKVETESATAVESNDNEKKRTYEAIDKGHLLTTTQKARKVSVAAEVVEEAGTQPACHSVHAQPTKPIVKRKQHTKAEIEADKEKAEKKRKKEMSLW
jgi:hypothetical protein